MHRILLARIVPVSCLSHIVQEHEVLERKSVKRLLYQILQHCKFLPLNRFFEHVEFLEAVPYSVFDLDLLECLVLHRANAIGVGLTDLPIVVSQFLPPPEAFVDSKCVL